MSTVHAISRAMDAWAPAAWAMPRDNVGLLVGDGEGKVRRVLVALDCTDAVLAEAVEGGYDLLVTHHPLFRDPVLNVTTDTPVGKKIFTLIARGIALFCAHTNLDAAPDGVNDLLFARLPLSEKAPLVPRDAKHPDTPTIGLVGTLEKPLPLSEWAGQVSVALETPPVRYVGDPDRIVKKIALCGGSGASLVSAAIAQGCDVLITGDIRYHDACDANDAGLALIDATHYATEIPIVDAVAAYIMKQFPTLTVRTARASRQIFKI